MQQNNISDLLSYANELDIKNPKLASKIDQIVLGMVREAGPQEENSLKKTQLDAERIFGGGTTGGGGTGGGGGTKNTLQNLGILKPLALTGAEAYSQRANALYNADIFRKIVLNDAKEAGTMYAIAKKQNNVQLLGKYDAILKQLAKSYKKQVKSVYSEANKIIFLFASTIDPQILIYIKSLKDPKIIDSIKAVAKGKNYKEVLPQIAKIQKTTTQQLSKDIEVAVNAAKPNLSAKAVNLIEKIAEQLHNCVKIIPGLGNVFSVPVIKTMLSEAFSVVDGLTSFISLYNQFQNKTGSPGSKVCYFLNFLFNVLQIVFKIPAVVALTSGSSLGWSVICLSIGFSVDLICSLSNGYAFNEAKRLQPTITQSDLSPKDLLASNQLIQMKDRKTINNNFKNMVMNNQFEDPNKVGAYLRNQLLKPITQSAPVAPKTPITTPTTQSDKSVPITSGQPSTAVVA